MARPQKKHLLPSSAWKQELSPVTMECFSFRYILASNKIRMNKVLLVLLLPLVICREAEELLKAINAYRKSKSLKELKRSKQLTEVARDRVESLICNVNLFATQPDIWTLVKEKGFNVNSVGENIGKSIYKDKKGVDIFGAWINSETHRENILDAHEYTHIGVYRLVGEKSVYVSAIFAREDERPPPKLIPNGNQAPQKQDEVEGLDIRSTRRVSKPDQGTVSKKKDSVFHSGAQPLSSSLLGQSNPDLAVPKKEKDQPPQSTYLLTLPASAQSNNAVIKLVVVKEGKK